MIELEVLLFAALKDVAHANCIVVQLDQPSNVSHLLQATSNAYPKLAPYLPHVRVAVNCEYVDGQMPVREGDEVALLPPVSGG